MRLLSDLSETEKRITDKTTRGESLSPEEEKILISANKKFEDKLDNEDFMKEITLQLNEQVEFVDLDLGNDKNRLKILV